MATLDITESKTLLEFLLDLLNDKDALADFRDDPHAALQDAGLGDCTVDDIKELLPVVLEKVDAEECARYEDDCDEDKCWDSEPKHEDDDFHGKPVECDDEGRPAPHCSPTEQVVAHLNYVTNNYSYDSNDTYVENNNITKIWAGDDADIDVTNNNVTAGSDGVAVGGDNNGEIVDGDGNVVGDDNQVSGQGSTTAFGDGDATSFDDFGLGDGSALVVGDGNTTAVDNSDNSTNDSGNLDNVGNDNSETIIKTDNSQDNDVVDSNNDNSDDDGLDIDTGDIDVTIDPIGALPLETV